MIMMMSLFLFPSFLLLLRFFVFGRFCVFVILSATLLTLHYTDGGAGSDQAALRQGHVGQLPAPGQRADQGAAHRGVAADVHAEHALRVGESARSGALQQRGQLQRAQRRGVRLHGPSAHAVPFSTLPFNPLFSRAPPLSLSFS